ncbi:AlwI family type II restriction endonuclease [Desulfosporosinus shakirovi]|uniref:AlwI family type II restriction endonuclease n=1 Tax=Desulfosporosinus shakirovi TaxID=2885154 RepID=UPI001E3858A3|nr:AlwI family type II restriction endonuclease [Desulfosporosinus sp. SRJS8]MCB8815732.1 AlwI family type II restriction endonuclease [Desulfosporosinus sp. SRJS8]
MASRKIWFITRPERDPKFHRDALLALCDATDGLSIKWSGNREAHLNFERKLNEQRIKREHVSNDGSGGRTWAAMLKTFAYVYTDEVGFLKLTKVGKAVMDGKKVRENVAKQILTLQIPNAYFLESGFRPPFESGFRIRPARFLIKLTNQPSLSYFLTKEEITFFALTAKTDDELPAVVTNIRKFRQGDTFEKALRKIEIAERYDHRERLDNSARSYEIAHGDVAHTFMLIAEYTGLVEYFRGKALRIDPVDSKRVSEEIDRFDQRYPYNSRYMISLQRMAENNGLDVDSYKASNYGSVKPATNKGKTENKIRELLMDYPNPGGLSCDELTSIFLNEFSQKEAEKYADELSQTVYQTLNNDFVEGYLNEQNNLLFEDKTGEIFKAIGFEVEMRPKPNANVTTEIEILLKYGDKLCGIIDAKNYRVKFALSASLASHMSSEYIPNYEGYKDRKVSFFGYVTAAGWSGEKNLEKISELAKRVILDRDIKGIMLSANVLLGFLDYCIDNQLSKMDRIELFLQVIDNRAYSSIGEFLRQTKITT